MSNFGKLNLADIGKGFLIAAGTVVITGLATSLEQGQFPDWPTLQALLLTGLGAGCVYLLKNLFTNSESKLAKKETNKL